ncbi:FtsK/SpoIIIE domain-containing protein [Solirubrobacter taibaiensis]|nr:FtsK/SpoIIIE domain-containing protein [Solirubrobacter taibaiensis]
MTALIHLAFALPRFCALLVAFGCLVLTGHATIPLVIAGLVVLSWPGTYSITRRTFTGRDARQWADACRHSGLYQPEGAQRGERPAPRLLRVEQAAAGRVLHVALSHGWTAEHVERAAPALATWYRARGVSVSTDPADVSRVQVLIRDTDPLAGLGGRAWPNLKLARLSLWEPVPVGVDEDGRVVDVVLAERNVLLAGEPGAGKSVAQSLIVATDCLDPYCSVWMLDGKGVDLAMWEPCCNGFAGANHDQAMAVLRDAAAWMDASYAELRATGKRKVALGDELGLLVIDELAFYVNTGTKKQQAGFNEALRDLIARGRAAGLISVLATQKPSSDVIPSSIRDLVAYRWALRCTTPEASDTALGRGWAARGYDASTISTSARGTGLLLAEGAMPVRCRSFYLADEDVEVLAQRAVLLREHLFGDVRDPVGEVGSGDLAESTEGAPLVPGPAPPPPQDAGRDWGTPLQRKIRAEIEREPEASNREVARRVGCDHKTVGRVRHQLEQ